MKKLTVGILGFAICFSFICCRDHITDIVIDDDPVIGDPVILVCFGDSLTAGYGAAKPGEDDRTKSYPAFLQERFDGEKINILAENAGVSGDTTGMGLLRVENDVLAKDPGIVIIQFGANDLFKTVLEGANLLSTTESNLQGIIEKVNDGKRKIYLVKFYTEPVAKEMVLNLYPYLENMSITYEEFLELIDELVPELIKIFDDIYDSLASKNNVELIEDIWDGVWGIPGYMSDEVHPSAAGYKIMADNYFKALKPYLLENDYLK